MLPACSLFDDPDGLTKGSDAAVMMKGGYSPNPSLQTEEGRLREPPMMTMAISVHKLLLRMRGGVITACPEPVKGAWVRHYQRIHHQCRDSL